MTNGDFIRNMTDEELAERFVDSLCMSKRECADFDTITPEKCHACVVEWLQEDVQEMSKRKDDFGSERENRDKNCSLHISRDSFCMIYDSMLKSKAFQELNPGAKNMYILCRSQNVNEKGKQCLYAHAKENGIDYPTDCFVFPAAHMEEYGIQRANGGRALKQLINGGFIRKYEDNQHRWKVNVYQFCDEWKRK